MTNVEGREFVKEVVSSLKMDKNKLILVPITYEDFLSTSAIGIFKSNLSIGIEENNVMRMGNSTDNKAILEKAIGRKIISQHDSYSVHYKYSRL